MHKLAIDFDATYTKTSYNSRTMYIGNNEIWYESAHVAGRFYLTQLAN